MFGYFQALKNRFYIKFGNSGVKLPFLSILMIEWRWMVEVNCQRSIGTLPSSSRVRPFVLRPSRGSKEFFITTDRAHYMSLGIITSRPHSVASSQHRLRPCQGQKILRAPFDPDNHQENSHQRFKNSYSYLHRKSPLYLIFGTSSFTVRT